MKSLADGLPPDIARQVHPEWRKNEAAYWSDREQLVQQYNGKWIAFAAGSVVAAASRPMEVFIAVQGTDQHPFVIRVGHENEPGYHIRRTTFAYDSTYMPTSLPVLTAEFRCRRGAAGSLFDRIIPDTGADTTTFPWPDCQRLKLDPALGVPGVISGVGGGRATTIGFLVWVWLDGKEYPCQLQADFGGRERILGRDVLNSLDILFRGPSSEVVVNPR